MIKTPERKPNALAAVTMRRFALTMLFDCRR